MKNYLKLPLDTNKRHFVVGDVHGRYETFLDLLTMIDYDPENDIIYSVGDIIDRGSKSYETIKFFQEMPNTYVACGNHEEMVRDLREWDRVWTNNGGIETMQSLKANGVDLHWLVDYCETLPYVIDVGEEDEEGSFRIVHAEIPPHWDELYVRNALQNNSTGIDEMIWSRTTITKALRNLSMMKPPHEDIYFNPNRANRSVFVGHTPIDRPITVRDTTFIDTWAGGTMTLIDALTKEKYTAKVID